MSNTLPRHYKNEPTREREVALYIDGGYITRGPASTGRVAALNGWKEYDHVVPPSRLTWELDRPAYGDHDAPNLCWGNGTMTSEQFLAWLRETAG